LTRIIGLTICARFETDVGCRLPVKTTPGAGPFTGNWHPASDIRHPASRRRADGKGAAQIRAGCRGLTGDVFEDRKAPRVGERSTDGAQLAGRQSRRV
jgi:hypothetical protein